MSSYKINLELKVAWRKLDRRIVVVQEETQQHYLLNELGSRIWSEIVKGKPLDKAIRTIAGEYVVSLERAERDVHAFLDGLVAEKILALEKID